MPDVISLLERIGQDAALKGAAPDQTLARFDPETQAALRNPDRSFLEMLLGAQPNIFCGQHPAKEDDEDEGEEQEDGGEDQEEDDQHPSASRALGAF